MSGLVIVSGASRGLGAELLRQVPFSARTVDLSRTARAADSAHEHVAVDLATEAGWLRAAGFFDETIAQHAGERVILFHNAGTLDPIGFAGEVDAPAYIRNVLLNSAAPQILGDAFLRAAARHSVRGTLVMISSGAADKVYEGWSSYCAGKAALEHWVRTAGAEQARRAGCNVFSIRPGVVDTEMQSEIRNTAPRDFPEVARFIDRYHTGGLRAPNEVARDLWMLLEREPANGSVLGDSDLGMPAR